MAETDGTTTGKTAQDVLDDLGYIMFPEGKPNTIEAESAKPVTGGAYDYFYEQFHNNSDWEEFENYYQEYLGGKGSPNVPLTVALLEDKQELLNLRLSLEGVDEKIDIREIPEIIEAAKQEAARNQERDYSNSAAMDAYLAYEANHLKGTQDELLENVNQAVKAGVKKSQDDKNQQIIESLNKAAEANNLEYLVRGAPLFCNCGSHSRHLDMTTSHGVYVNDKAVAFEEDYRKDINISYFGHCSSLTCTLTETISLSVGANVDTDGNNLSEASESVFVDIKCVPGFNKPWENVHKGTMIARDAVEEVFGAGVTEYKAALTTSSYLICEQGGVIYPLTSGQYDASYYTAPFAGYPFNDYGSDIFKKWCEERGICPYVPGSPDYYTWNTEKIGKSIQKGKELQDASDKWLQDAAQGTFHSQYGGYQAYINPYPPQINANRENTKKAYEEFLDGAYIKGLDTMSPEERARIKAMVQEYLESGLLTDKEKEEAEKKYSGLRLEYGHNNQKNQTGYTYKDQALYEETLQRLKDIQSQIEEDRKIPDYSYNQYESRSRYGVQAEKARNAYERFMAEIVTYGPGYSGLSPEQQKEVQEIYETYHAALGNSNPKSLEEELEQYKR